MGALFFDDSDFAFDQLGDEKIVDSVGRLKGRGFKRLLAQRIECIEQDQPHGHDLIPSLFASQTHQRSFFGQIVRVHLDSLIVFRTPVCKWQRPIVALMDHEVANSDFILDKNADRVEIWANFHSLTLSVNKFSTVKAKMVQIDLGVLILELEA